MNIKCIGAEIVVVDCPQGMASVAAIEEAVEGALVEGYRTADIAGDGGELTDTVRMGSVIAGRV